MTLKEMLAGGTEVHLNPAAPQADRVVEAAWIANAVAKGVRVDVEYALIRSPLKLRYGVIEKEFRIAFCTIEEHADLAYATFKSAVDFSHSTFQFGSDFQGSSFQFDVVFDGAAFEKRALQMSRTKVTQRLLAEGVNFDTGVTAYFDYCSCGHSAVFTGAKFGGAANFQGAAIVGSGMFSGAAFFLPATFENARIDGDLFLGIEPEGNPTGAIFGARADFTGCHVGGRVHSRGAEFREEAVFVWAKVEGATSFGSDGKGLNAARFGATADFRDSVFGGDVDFEGIIFQGQAKFSSASCEGTMTFKGAQFQDTAEFDGMRVHEELNFEGARFNSPVHQANFEKAVVSSSLFLSGAHFDGGASFEGLRIEGAVAQFRDVHFVKSTSFNVAEFAGSAEFRRAQFQPESAPVFDGVHFGGGCSFDGATFDAEFLIRAAEFEGEASFQGVTFRRKSDFSISHFASIARFKSKPAQPGGTAQIPAAAFNGAVSFEHARFDRDARFDDAIFRDSVNLREASFRVVYLAGNGRVGNDKQLQGAVDLTGCTYDRIQADWKALLEALHAYEQQPRVSYSRQPYAQLEKTCRAVGQDRAADDIYLERRQVERGRLRLFRGRFLDWSYFILANYGVRPWQLIVYALVGILLATVGFCLPGSVQSKKDANSTTSQTCPFTTQGSLKLADAGRLAVRYFLPVDVSVLPGCEASSNYCWRLRFQDWAALIHVLGWLLVPVGIASLTGILRRVAP